MIVEWMIGTKKCQPRAVAGLAFVGNEMPYPCTAAAGVVPD